MNYLIIKSIKKYLDDIVDLKLLVYDDSLLDISKTFSVSPDVNLPLGTETTFVMVDNDDGANLTNTDDDYFKHWYLKYSGINDDIFIRIIDYDNITGRVIIEESFGEAVSTSDTLDLIVLDAIFVDAGEGYQSYMKSYSTDENLPIYLRLQTKEDSRKEKIYDYIYLIKGNIVKDKKKLVVYDNDEIRCGNMQIYGAVKDRPIIQNDTQLQTSSISFTVRYTMNYENI